MLFAVRTVRRFVRSSVVPAPAPVAQDAQNAEIKIESADDQSVDWQKKFEDSERVNRQLRVKINAMAKRINKKMKLAKLEKDKTKEKLDNLFGKNSLFTWDIKKLVLFR